MGTRIPLQNNPNYVGIDIDQNSVGDASTTYEYIKEAALGTYRVDYLASTSNLPATVLMAATTVGPTAWLKSLLPWGGSAERRMYYVAVDERDDFKTLPCDLEANAETPANVDQGLLEQYNLFSAPMDLALKPGDRVLVDYVLGPNGTPQSYGYITQKLSGKTPLPSSETGCGVLVDRFEQGDATPLADLQPPANSDAQGTPVDDDGEPPVEDGRYRTPFGPVDSSIFQQGAWVSSEFGVRVPPSTSGGRVGSANYPGLDIGMRQVSGHSAPIYAVAEARVIFSGPQPCKSEETAVGLTMPACGGGEYIKIRWEHEGDTYDALYMHLRSNGGRLVDQGDSVRAGQHIGYSGNTGNSTGPHLHFELKVNGSGGINPRDYLPVDSLPEQRTAET